MPLTPSAPFIRTNKEQIARALTVSITYFVALPFVQSEDGIVPGEAQDCPHEFAAVRKAEAMSRTEPNVGALAFKRTGTPETGNFADAVIIKSFGKVPTNLDEL
jgi:hypothetical protein